MKQIIKSTINYLLIGTILMFCLSSIIYSIDLEHVISHYEDEQIVKKIQYYETHKEKYNTIFIGTSRIYRQVNPFLFDSLTNETSSYNASHANLRPYRSYDYAYFLNLDENVKNVFIEMVPPSRIGGNYNANPELFSINYHKYFSIIDFCLKSNFPLKFKAYYFLNYSQTFFYKYLGFGLKKYIALIADDHEADLEPLFYDIDKTQGYLPYEAELALHKNQNLIKRRESFLQNSAQILSQSIKNSNTPNIGNDISKDQYIQDLIDLENHLREKNIKVYHIVSPRKKPWDLAYIESMKRFVSGDVIDLSSPTKYPEFYEEMYSFDTNHLNKAGSRLFTKELFKIYDESNQSN
ncbi:hypothetical protein [Marivirga sp.]|uniref:hypothetical protein n=1 Tax=Marivirga sp. TaxID=2018662 RepID=UPI003DA6F4DA